MGVVNEHKQKIAELSSSPQEPEPITQAYSEPEEPARKKGKTGKVTKK